MIRAVDGLAAFILKHLEDSLLPRAGGGTTIQKIARYAYQFFKFLVCLPAAALTSLLSFAVRPLRRPQEESLLVAFAKRPYWEPDASLPDIAIGCASCDVQDNGPGRNPCNWSEDYSKAAKALNMGSLPATDHWDDRFVDELKKLGLNSFRFSVSRHNIEPRPGEFSGAAMQRYLKFIAKLQVKGIEPMVTLSHFAEPLYFDWEKVENINDFIKFAEYTAELLYEAGVRKIVTINEPTVVAFQSKIMGEFPPKHKLDFEGAAVILHHMILAHEHIYHGLKAMHPDFEIGISHDPIRFRHYHKSHPLWTPVEKIICHYLTEINHTAFFKALETGRFSLKVPFRTNYQFDLGGPVPLDFIGLQYYTDPLIKCSFTKGGESVTRVPGEKLTDYQYRAYPQGLASAIDECRSLKTSQGEPLPIHITEMGIDTGINQKAGDDTQRIEYFGRLFQVIQKSLQVKAPVRSAYFWSLLDNFEWSRGFNANYFGLYSFDRKDGKATARGTAEWLKAKMQGRGAANASAVAI